MVTALEAGPRLPWGQLVQRSEDAAELPRASLVLKVRVGAIAEDEVGSMNGTKCETTCEVIATLKWDAGKEVRRGPPSCARRRGERIAAPRPPSLPRQDAGASERGFHGVRGPVKSLAGLNRPWPPLHLTTRRPVTFASNDGAWNAATE